MRKLDFCDWKDHELVRHHDHHVIRHHNDDGELVKYDEQDLAEVKFQLNCCIFKTITIVAGSFLAPKLLTDVVCLASNTTPSTRIIIRSGCCTFVVAGVCCNLLLFTQKSNPGESGPPPPDRLVHQSASHLCHAQQGDDDYEEE